MGDGFFDAFPGLGALFDTDRDGHLDPCEVGPVMAFGAGIADSLEEERNEDDDTRSSQPFSYTGSGQRSYGYGFDDDFDDEDDDSYDADDNDYDDDQRVIRHRNGCYYLPDGTIVDPSDGRSVMFALDDVPDALLERTLWDAVKNHTRFTREDMLFLEDAIDDDKLILALKDNFYSQG